MATVVDCFARRNVFGVTPLAGLLAEVTDMVPANEGLHEPALFVVLDAGQLGVEPAQIGGQVHVPAGEGTVSP
jgi:hypothetical protein